MPAWIVSPVDVATIGALLAGLALLIAAVCLQISRRKLARVVAERNAQLEMLEKRAEEAAQFKNEFLTNVSHEIRTPMNGILGMTQLALATNLNGEQLEYLQQTRESAEALLILLNDMLDLSRIEARKLEIDNNPFTLSSCVGETVRELEPLAQNRGLELVYEVNSEAPQIVLGDAARLSQVLRNLIAHSLKDTIKGDVTLMVKPTGATGAFTFVEFSVSDTGPGIPEDRQDAIFEPFEKGAQRDPRDGTGLGLAISKRLVQLMGGTLGLDSRPGQGSRFYFTIPMERCKQQSGLMVKETPVTPPASALKVLLAEDNPVNQQVALRILEKNGHRVEVVATGLEALSRLDQSAYDVVLMDVHMPEMDGLTATRLLREREQNGARQRTPVLAMTANAMRGDREKCLEAGMDDYVSKPIQVDHFLSSVYRLAQAARDGSAR